MKVKWRLVKPKVFIYHEIKGMTEEDIMSVSLCNDRDRTCSVKREMPAVLFMYVFVNDSQTTRKESHCIMCSKPHVKSWDGIFLVSQT